MNEPQTVGGREMKARAEARAASIVVQPVQEKMNITQVSTSVSLLLPATLAELERYCARLRTEHVNEGTAVRAGPVDGHTVRLYVNIEAS